MPAVEPVNTAPVTPASTSGPRFRYGWIVLAVAAAIVLIGAGARAAPGALLLGMAEDTGYSVGQIAVAGAAGLLLLGLAGPVSGTMIDRFGIRVTTVVALLLAALGLGASAFSHELWQLVLLFGFVAGFGAGLVSSSLGPVVANRWFLKGRGTVVGVFGGAASAGQLLFFPVLTATSVVFGWRVAAAGMALLLLIALVPALLFLVERPSDVGELPRGATADTPTIPVRADKGILRRAIGRPEFWLLAGTFFVCGATSNGLVGQHFIAHAVDHGYAAVAASGALALMGAFNFAGTLMSGWLSDRIDPRNLLLVYYVFRGISLLYLPALAGDGIIGFAVLFGLDYIATVPPTVMLIADTFGRHNVGLLYGWVYFSHMLGAAVAAILAGAIRDSAGSYATAFVIAGFVAMAAGVAALLIRRPKLVPDPVAVRA
jgi:sugar phosphate permease